MARKATVKSDITKSSAAPSGDTKIVTETQNKTEKSEFCTIENKSEANCKLIAVTGVVIEFDKDGRAYVAKKDADYLSKIKGFVQVE